MAPTGSHHRSTPREAAATIAIQSLMDAGDLRGAWTEGERVLRKLPESPDVHLLMAMIAERLHQPTLVRRHVERCLKVEEHPLALMTLAELEQGEGRSDAALELNERARLAGADTTPVLIQRAGILEEAGRFTDARAVIDPLVRSLEASGQPLPASLRYEVSKLLVQEMQYERAVDVIDGVLNEQSTPAQFRVLIGYLKAKALDRAGRYAEAFDAATQVNRTGRIEFDPALYEQQVTALIETWSAERIAEYPRATCDDATPVFVAGMPRSGTSLIDQIIDAHPLAAGVGELATIEVFAARLGKVYDPDKPPPDCFGRYNQFRWTSVAHDYLSEVRRSAPPGVQRIVNKSLGNNKLVGLLALLFPRTRIIHALRDPRDVAISCYMGGFNNRLHAWSTRIEWVASAWEQSLRLMDHWKCILEIPILDVRYEELVRDPDSQFPRLIEFLGLEWDEACRAFHQSRRTVRTLSYDQVNRPLYTTSAGRHTHYREQIADLRFPAY
ncbi:MAG: sulfotransferase [Phycisphaerales bacterium]|nr:sulfotransferase [Phycisphaerales bacterium]